MEEHEVLVHEDERQKMVDWRCQWHWSLASSEQLEWELENWLLVEVS